MDETPFIALMDDDGAKRFVNIRQIVMLEAGRVVAAPAAALAA